MIRLALALAVGILVALPHDAAADFAAGVAAYDRGDYETAYLEWLPLAESGDPAAQRNLGHLFRKGQGVTRDLVKAAEWYRRGAEFGFARAQANLASMHLQGDGVAQDYAEAAKWFERAANQGHAIAQYNLALMYERGLGVPRSEPKALAWYYNAARAGHKKAAARLATLVLREEAGPSAPAEASAQAAPQSMAAATPEEASSSVVSSADRPPTQTFPTETTGSSPLVEDGSASEPTPTAADAAGADAEAEIADAEAETADAETGTADEQAMSTDEEAVSADEKAGTADEQTVATDEEAVSADEETETADEEVVAVGAEKPGRRNVILRFFFAFNNELLVRQEMERSGWSDWRRPPASSKATEETPTKEVAAVGAATTVPGKEQGTDAASEPAGVLPSDEPASTVESPPPQPSAAMAPERSSEAPATTGVREPLDPPASAEPVAPSPSVGSDARSETETAADTATQGGAEASGIATESAQAAEAFSVLRWVVLAGAQTSGDLSSRSLAVSAALPADTAAASMAKDGDRDTATEPSMAVQEPSDAAPLERGRAEVGATSGERPRVASAEHDANQDGPAQSTLTAKTAADTDEGGGVDDSRETGGAVSNAEAVAPTPQPVHTALLIPDSTRFGGGPRRLQRRRLPGRTDGMAADGDGRRRRGPIFARPHLPRWFGGGSRPAAGLHVVVPSGQPEPRQVGKVIAAVSCRHEQRANRGRRDTGRGLGRSPLEGAAGSRSRDGSRAFRDRPFNLSPVKHIYNERRPLSETARSAQVGRIAGKKSG